MPAEDMEKAVGEEQIAEPKAENLDPKIGAWISQLPKDIRQSFEDRKEELPNLRIMAEKFLALEEEKKGSSQKYGDSDYEKVDAYFSDSEDGSVEKNLYELMKRNNVPPEELEGVLSNLKPEFDRRVEAERKKMRDEARKHFEEKWGDRFEENERFFERGKQILYDEEASARIAEKGLIYDSDFIELVTRVGRSESEETPNEGSHTEKKKTTAQTWGFKYRD